jgi:probable F420-dependent oxidoreductase
MSTARPFRFGYQTSNLAATSRDWADLARKVEDLGYSTLFVPDHFGAQHGPFVSLMAAADATTELRVGSLVFGNDYRHPVVLAKEAASLDVLSDGRLELGLGAGWMNTDYEQAGIAHDRPGVRVDRMEEAVAVLKGLFADGSFSYEGDHYKITGLDGQPKPAQSPHPPLLIGGGGKRVLTIAGREADIVGINPALRSGEVDTDAARNSSAAETDRKLQWVREGAGDRFDDLELNMLVFAVVVTDDRAGTIEKMAPLFGLDPEEIADMPHAWIGSVEEICDDLQRYRERWGVSYFVVQSAALDAAAPVVAHLAGN